MVRLPSLDKPLFMKMVEKFIVSTFYSNVDINQGFFILGPRLLYDLLGDILTLGCLYIDHA